MASGRMMAVGLSLLLSSAIGGMSWADAPPAVQRALEQAGENRPQLEQALKTIAADEREGLEFLLVNMPQSDLRGLKAEFLVQNVDYAYRALKEARWKERIPRDVFLNEVLPYANINERRDNWRKDFYDKCRPLVHDAASPGQAAAILNQKIFALFKVKYSTKRNRADQGPSESIETGLASCTGLSILLIDCCRAVGVPARFVGTPLWADNSGNHSWVEVWDEGWHFTGAAEPAGEKLDEAWFAGKASGAARDDRMHAVYAVSFRRTPTHFPLVWAPEVTSVFAVNVTDRYTQKKEALPEGSMAVSLRAVEGEKGERTAATVEIKSAAGETVFRGETKDERFDANDHLRAVLKAEDGYTVTAKRDVRTATAKLNRDLADRVVTLVLPVQTGAAETPAVAPKNESKPADEAKPAKDSKPSEKPAPPAAPPPAPAKPLDQAASTAAVAGLTEYLAKAEDQRGKLADQVFTKTPLSKSDAAAAQKLLWEDHARRIRTTRAGEMKERKIQAGDKSMPFFYSVAGEKPEGGRSLYISLHGGGGAPKQVNDSQWANQQRLYTVKEGVYLVPRAPTDTWNLWHEGHIDGLLDRLIENLVVFEEVNPNRVYLFGYSAGGDGVYQLAPRMADRLAAATMMAGHPNDASPLGLRNLPFAIWVGGKDAAYNRNQVARDWGGKLDQLQKDDAQGYPHVLKVLENKGHWMDREDAAALPWMAGFNRDVLPKKVVWKQAGTTHERFYWLAVEADQKKPGAEVIALREKQSIELSAKGVERVVVRLSDAMLDLDQEVTITSQGKTLLSFLPQRTIAILAKTLGERGDPSAVFSSEASVVLPK